MYPTTNLQPGTSSQEVQKLQNFLVFLGLMTPTELATGPGIYGPKTTAAVTKMQQMFGGGTSGVYDASTISAIQKANPQLTTTPGQFTYTSKDGLNTIGVKGGQSTSTLVAPATKTDPNFPHYGQKDNLSEEQRSYNINQMTELAAAGSGMIDAALLASNVTSKPDIVALYVNALTYGGYTTGDIINDIKRRELASQGNETAKNMQLISSDMKRSDFILTQKGQESLRLASTVIPTFNFQGLLNPEILKWGSNMPDEVFKILSPIQDSNSQEFKDAVENIKSIYYDIMNNKLTANTEQEKILADHSYDEFKEALEKKYNIILNDNAQKAMTQIEALAEDASKRGIQGSGLQNEAVDEYLKQTRLQDTRSRDDKAVTADSRLASEMKTSGTAAQIQKIIDEDASKGIPKAQSRAAQWGLIPSAEAAENFSIAHLQAEFPDESPERIKRIHDAMIDENGNYRSSTQRTYYESINTNLDSERTAAENVVRTKAQNDELRASAEWDGSQPYSESNDSLSGTGREPTAEEKKQRDIDNGILNQDGTPVDPNNTPEKLAETQKQIDDLKLKISAYQKSRGLPVTGIQGDSVLADSPSGSSAPTGSGSSPVSSGPAPAGSTQQKNIIPTDIKNATINKTNAPTLAPVYKQTIFNPVNPIFPTTSTGTTKVTPMAPASQSTYVAPKTQVTSATPNTSSWDFNSYLSRYSKPSTVNQTLKPTTPFTNAVNAVKNYFKLPEKTQTIAPTLKKPDLNITNPFNFYNPFK